MFDWLARRYVLRSQTQGLTVPPDDDSDAPERRRDIYLHTAIELRALSHQAQSEQAREEFARLAVLYERMADEVLLLVLRPRTVGPPPVTSDAPATPFTSPAE